MIVFGIDPSLTSTAICWGSAPGSFELAVIGSESRGKALPGRIERVRDLATEVRDLVVKQAGDQPASVCIESYSFNSRNNREYLGEYGGILRLLLYEFTSQIFEVAPTTLKKFTTGSGKGKKLGMVGTVAKRFGHVFDTDDETDAFCLWRLGLAISGQLGELHKYESDAVETATKAGDQ